MSIKNKSKTYPGNSKSGLNNKKSQLDDVLLYVYKYSNGMLNLQVDEWLWGTVDPPRPPEWCRSKRIQNLISFME
jgi:hypothetical protein